VHLAGLLSLVSRPTGPLFDIVLLAHIICVIVSVIVVAVSGFQGRRLRAISDGVAPTGELARYYSPGINIAGRLLHAVPVLGFVLIGLSHGFFGLQEGWILAGLMLWVVAAALAEGALWPAEHRIQVLLGAEGGVTEPVRVDARRAARSAALVVVILLAATVLMLAQP
jgi:hypothetical protein